MGICASGSISVTWTINVCMYKKEKNIDEGLPKSLPKNFEAELTQSHNHKGA